MSGNRLGRGLGSLLPEENGDQADGEYILCDIDEIEPNPYQPRQEMDDTALGELSASIKEKGVLQPLVVTRDLRDSGLGGGGYILIAGERRLRASQLAGLSQVPVIVKEVDNNQDRLELALIENIQRQNLNPLEEALAYAQLTNEFSLTQEEVAKQVGKERSTVANTLRLLNLPDFAKEDVATGRLAMGHARVLLSLSDPKLMRLVRDKIVERGLTVRKAEALVKEVRRQEKNGTTARVGQPPKRPIPTSYCKTLNNDFVKRLGTKSKIIQNGQRGKIEIEYYSLDDLERIHRLINQLQD
ncbi:MAG: ParB/RepB/Spo0J family partition protein [Thermodesulfobacteriota bacterium]